jgi:hypothetical protein
MTVDELKSTIKQLDEKGALEEIIQRNDSKYKLLSNPRGAIAAFDNASRESQKLSVYGVAGKDGNVLVDFENESKTVSRPSSLIGKKDAYALNLCSRRLGSLLPSRSILVINPQEVASVGDIAAYYVKPNEVKIISIREDDNGKLYGIRWNPDEKIEFSNNDLSNLHKVVAIYL